ncbi:MAG: MFS transporter [Acidobacteria bacterium]|nr:MFS transporter [Acidobacteriota bacterium]MYE42501.1 MFS transporter [Acidobacteriota bacterium]
MPDEGSLRVFRRHRLLLTVLLFAGYAGYYLGRVTVPVALPLIGEAFDYSNTQTGLILSVYFAVYAASKLVNGFLGDRIGGKAMFFIGLFGSVLMNAAFGFGRELFLFVAIWGVNAYFQTMGWLAVMPIMARWYPSRESGRVMGFMSISYQLGDFLARASAAVLIVALGWSGLFWAHASLLALFGLALYRLIKPEPPPAIHPAGPREAQPEGAPPGAERSRSRRRMLRSPAFWILCASYVLLSVVRYSFWGWSVDYLVQAGAGIGAAAATSALFPLLGSAGSITAGWVSDRLGARRGPVLAVMCAVLTFSIYVFSRLPVAEGPWLAAALGLVGFTLYGPYSLMSGAMVMDFGGKEASASASGIVDGIGAAGAIFAGVGMGYLIDAYGWDGAFGIIVAMASVATVLNALLWRHRPLRAATDLED